MLKNEKVEWKKLGDEEVTLSIRTGLNPRKNFVLNNSDGEELNCWYITTKDYSINEKIEYTEGKTAKITESARQLINKRSNLDIYDILFSAVGTVGKVAYVDIEPTNFDVNESTFVIKPNQKYIVPKFLVYYLRSDKIQSKVRQSLKGSTLAGIRKNKLENLEIPIPSLKIQEKIAKALDKFTNYLTELQSELQSELQLRNKQYKYYRDKLLSEEHLNKLINKYDLYKYELKEKTLGEVIKLKNGRDWKTLNEGSIPVYGSGGPMNIGVNQYSYDKETVLIPRKGSIDNIFYLNEPFWNVDTIYYTEVDTNLLNVKYFYYFMKNIDLLSLSINPTRPSLTQEIINNIKMTLPPIEIQEKIVEILDKFQALIQDVSGSLPDEIEKRGKQYEYYREKLLAFDTKCTRGYQVLSNDYIGLLTQAGNLVGVKVFELLKKKLEDVCEILDSKRKPIKKSKRIKGIYPYYGANGIQDYVNDFIFDGSFVLMGEDGSVIDKNNNPILHWVSNKKIWVNNHAHVLKNKNDFINLKYIYYSLSISDVSSIVKGTPPKINQANLRNIKILIPPLPIQEYIVSILDKFEALSQSTTEGLRHEIELREKQYEYYREKLLTFEK